VAGTLHTVVFLAILFGSASLMYVSAGRMRAAEQPNRVLFYITTIAWEWLLMGYVLVGVRLHPTPLWEVMGARWTKPRDVFRDIAIALAFWIGALIVLALVARLLHFQGMKQNVRFLAPDGAMEIALWIAVSVTAGICEETIFGAICRSNSSRGREVCRRGYCFPPQLLGSATFIREPRLAS
jgi:hypothetical protein